MPRPERWFAHSLGSTVDRSGWEPLRDHLQAVGRRAREFADAFGAGGLGEAAGLLHDLGKYHEGFQRRLAGDGRRHDHSTAGAQVAVQRYGPHLGKLLAYGIAGHHAGLADGIPDGSSERTALRQRLARPVDADAALREALADGVLLPELLALPPLCASTPALRGFQLAFLGRMVFSCLVDADYLETERFYVEAGEKSVERTAAPPLADIRAAFDAYLEREIAPRAGTSPVNQLRAEVLAQVRAQASRKPGVFTLTVPTGGGKTLTSLAFALDHAVRHGLRRIVYVIPFVSVIEQTADVFRQALGPFSGAVLEHHSAFDETEISGREGLDKLRLAMENWDAPLVVTTAVQFFESLFADRPSRCRKLHNLARSVIVLDEAQTLPLAVLRPCVAALDELARNYGATIVLCTATQPALRDTGDARTSFRGGFRKVHELAPDVPRLFAGLRRVDVKSVGALSDDALAERLSAARQVLCIVNTRAHARDLFERIAGLPGARHLSTTMCAAHRRAVLAEIRTDLEAGRPCRVVSTSLVEAGVDLDFPLVYRAEAGLDSIAQAAGRCNREGRRDWRDSQTIVFEVEDKDRRVLKSLRRYADAARAIMRAAGDPLSPEAIEAYFREVYWIAGEEHLDRRAILARCGRRANDFDLPFETIARLFRMIDDIFVPVIVPYGRVPGELVAALCNAEHVGALARKLQPYTVGVPKEVRNALVAAGAAIAVAPERFGDQFVWLTNGDLYKPSIGLDWSDPAYRESGGLIA